MDLMNYESANYIINYKDDGVYLTVNSSKGELTKEDETRILDCIKRKRIKSLDTIAVFRAMHLELNNMIKIADKQKEEIIDQEIKVEIVNGGLEANAMLLPPLGGEKLSFEKAKQLINQSGVVFGIDEKAIKEMLEKQAYYKKVSLARGEKAQKGKDAKLQYHIEFNSTPKPKILEDGSVDYRHLDLIQNVKKGQSLVSIVPSTQGIDGTTVTGKDIMARPGKNVALPRGKNVVLSEDRLELIAGVDGKAEIIDGKIHIYAIYEIRGNVDNSTGNIDFIGNVIVNGNILTGFIVKAGGYIEVKGVVEGAELSAKGDVVLRKGIRGMGRGTIVSQGNVISRFIENSTITAKGNIVSEAIMHSRVDCGGKIEVAGKRGLIVGGTICAGVGISAKTIGSPMATITELEVGISPLLRDEYSLLVKKLERVERENKKANQILNLFDKMELSGALSPDRVDMRLKTIKTRLANNEMIPKIKARILELETIFKAVSSGRIDVQNNIYQGVKVVIGTSTQYIKDEEKWVTFKREYGDIVRIPYST